MVINDVFFRYDLLVKAACPRHNIELYLQVLYSLFLLIKYVLPRSFILLLDF